MRIAALSKHVNALPGGDADLRDASLWQWAYTWEHSGSCSGRSVRVTGASRAEDAHAAEVGDELVVGAIGAVAYDCPASNHAQELVQGHALPCSMTPLDPDRVVLQLRL